MAMIHSPQALLIAGLVDGRSMKPAIAAGLTEEHFPEYQDAWVFLDRYHRRMARPPSREFLQARFARLEWPLGQEEHVEQLIEHVRRDWLSRSLSEAMLEASMLVSRADDPEAALGLLSGRTRDLAMRFSSGDRDLDLTQDWQYFYDDAVGRVTRASMNQLPGITTGFKILDKLSGGLENTELITALARQGQGKSWMLLYMAASALLQGKRVCFHPLEMSPTQVGFRLHVILQSLMGSKLRFKNTALTQGRGYDLKSYHAYLQQIEADIKGRMVLCDGRRQFSPTQVLAKIQEHQPDIVFVDYLTLMASSGGRLQDWADVRALTGELKGIAMDHRVPLVVAAQANRLGAERKGPPELVDIAFGDAIGMDSDRVFSFKRMSKRVTWARVIKNRHGGDRVSFYLAHDYDLGEIKEVSEDRGLELIDDDREGSDAGTALC